MNKENIISCIICGRKFNNYSRRKGRINKIIQLPMSIPTFIRMMDEMQSDYKRQEKQMKSKGKKR